MLSLAGLALAVLAGGCSAGPPAGRARPTPPPVRYYLALGDSLAQGVQPDPLGVSVRTAQGYPDQLYAMLRRQQPGLRLVKLGCPGETTVTMMHGGICAYPGGSQLAAAVRFLREHRSRVWLVTLDIAANDPDSCVTASSAGGFASCVVTSIPRAATDLETILTALRRAAPHVKIVGMSYYLPALAEWRHGLLGQITARLGELAVDGYNALLARAYQKHGVAVADVSGAFRTGEFSPQVSVPGFGPLPSNVAAICQWTWECTPPPRGPNEHPNQAGYGVIARAFLAALDRPRPAGADRG